MARKSVVVRNEKRKKLVALYKEQRNKLKALMRDPHLSDGERWEAGKELQKLPRDSSLSRVRNRCKLCHRPRAYNKKLGLCRFDVRMAAIHGMVPGMHKASW